MIYVAMGHLISLVTRQTLGEFFRTHIWEPLGMNETFISRAEAHAARPEVDISRGYYTDRAGHSIDVGDYDLTVASGAGNIVSSAADYAKWLRATIDRALPVSPSAHAQLVRAHSIIGPEVFGEQTTSLPITYGFGWFIRSYHGELLIFHGGNQPGFATGVFFIPRLKFGLVLFSNNMIAGDLAIQTLAYGLIDDQLQIPDSQRPDLVSPGDELLRMINSTFTREMLQLLYPTILDPPLPPSANLSAFMGLYTHAAYPPLNITDGGDHCAGDLLPPLTDDTKPVKLCMTLFNNAINHYAFAEIMHISGDFWVFGAEFAGMPSLTKVEFRLGPDGYAQNVGMVVEPGMKGEFIWWDRVKDS
jgi:hypothetical protein